MRLLTYNIHKGIGGRDRRYRLERVVEVIARERPELICLQEVDLNVPRSRRDNQPKRLAAELPAPARFFQKNVYLKSGGYGNLILSKWPLRSRHQITLRYRGKKPRGAQLAVIATPDGPLQLVNLHLGLAERERHWQIRRLLTHRLFDNSPGMATIVAGDLNDWRNTLGRGPFGEHGFTQATLPASRFRTFPAWLPMGSLDKVFYRGVELLHVRVARTQLARRASDHLPLVVDFGLAGEGKVGGC